MNMFCARMVWKFRPLPTVGVALALTLAGCILDPAPYKLNRQIDEGEAAEALTKAEAKLAKNPEGEAEAQFSLIAAKARLELCVQRGCVARGVSGTIPELLQPVSALLTKAQKAELRAYDKKVSPITTSQVLVSETARFATMPAQPEAGLVLYKLAPAYARETFAEALFAPSLALARQGKPFEAAAVLDSVKADTSLPQTMTYMAGFLAAGLKGEPDMAESYLIAMRSQPVSSTLPMTAAALVPWVVLNGGGNKAVSGTEGLMMQAVSPTNRVMAETPDILRSWKVPLFQTPAVLNGMARELANPEARAMATWKKGWQGGTPELNLAMQKLSLALNPNQPELWAKYLPALVANAARTKADIPDLGSSGFVLGTVTRDTAEKLGDELLTTTQRLVPTPAASVPLVVMAAQLPLNNVQQGQFAKLVQDLILRSAALHDVTTTFILAQAKPQAAQNNRNVVVKLLVEGIRDNLRGGNFETATHMAETLNSSLKLDIEYGPIILEEFEDDMQRQGMESKLVANVPDLLLQPQADVEMDLGPLFGFMRRYFVTDPNVTTGQLTTMIGQAGGVYGPAVAMYRLGHLFPSSTMPEDKQREWLGRALTSELVSDPHLTGPEMVGLASRLLPLHPELDVATVTQAALQKTQTADGQQALWQAASPNVRDLMRVTHPQFFALMTGAEAMQKGDFSTAAASFQALTDANWRKQAAPYIEPFFRRLVMMGGVYVPEGGKAGSLTPAAILISPTLVDGEGLLNMDGTHVTLLSRMGKRGVVGSSSMETSYGGVQRLDLTVPFDFAANSFQLTQDVLAQTPQGLGMAQVYGPIRQIKVVFAEGTVNLKVYMAKQKAPLTYVRVLARPDGALQPNGVYVMTGRLGTPPADTAGILPPGSLLQLITPSEQRMLQAGEDSPSPGVLVYPVSGFVQHPASDKALPLQGFYDPLTLTATLGYKYPLPHSHEPVEAAVRCQILTGQVLCGAHHVHSPRLQYAALSVGAETQESARISAKRRAALNADDAEAVLASAMTRLNGNAVEAGMGLVSDTTTGGNQKVSATQVAPGVPVSPTAAVEPKPESSQAPAEKISATDKVSATEVSAVQKSAEVSPVALEGEPADEVLAPQPSALARQVANEPVGKFIHHVETSRTEP
jgi:hypothetical protein